MEETHLRVEARPHRLETLLVILNPSTLFRHHDSPRKPYPRANGPSFHKPLSLTNKKPVSRFHSLSLRKPITPKTRRRNPPASCRLSPTFSSFAAPLAPPSNSTTSELLEMLPPHPWCRCYPSVQIQRWLLRR